MKWTKREVRKGPLLLVACLSLLLSLPARARAQNEIDFDKELEKTSQLIVMVTASKLGAGIIFGREKDRLLIATAYHVLPRDTPHPTVRVELKSMPGKLLNATLLKFDAATDLAVLSVEKPGIDVCALPFDRLGDVAELERRGAVSAVGNPNGVSWAMPVEPDKISQLSPTQIVFQSTFISEGHSGGGLLNQNAAIVGMVVADQPPFGRALRIDAVFQLVKQWGLPVTLQEKSSLGGDTLLHIAARKGDVAGIKNLLAACGEVNARNDGGSVPIHSAAMSDSIEAIQLLWKAGADLNVMDSFGETPLVWAVWAEKVGAVRFLLQAGAKVNAKNAKGETALHIATRGPAEIVKMLAMAGADLNAINKDGQTPLHAAIEGRMLQPQGTWSKATPRWLDVIKFLVGAGAKTPAIALFNVARFSEVENIKILLQAVFDLNAHVTSEYSSYYPGSRPLLHWATIFGELEIVKLLIDAGADVNSLESGGTTALLAAFVNNKPADKPAIQDLLIAHGARIGNRGFDERGLDRPLIRAVMNRQLAVVKVLIAAGANPNTINPYVEPRRLLLYEAIEKGDVEIVKVLVKGGADVNAERDGETPLRLARRKGHAAIEKVLLEAGAVSRP